MISIPLDRCMFSCPGSYLSIGPIDKERYREEARDLGEGVYIRQLYGAGRRQCIKVSALSASGPVQSNLSASPSVFSMAAAGGYFKMTFSDPHRIAGKGQNTAIRLEMKPVQYEYAAPLDDCHFLINSAASRIQFLITVYEGTGVLQAPYGEQCCQSITLDIKQDDVTGSFLFTVEDFHTVMPVYKCAPDFETCADEMARKFDRFISQFPVLAERYRDAGIDALYVMWSCIVEPAGNLTRHAVLMSNNWMPNVWTWDSVINAMALVIGDQQLAKKQFFTSLDHETAEGLVPDYFNPMEVMWNFTKPPIHGIAILHGMMDVLDEEELAQAYSKMQRQIDYWLHYMDSDHDGIPQYNHGNDCGWDNCTSFRVGPPIEGPDLTSYIILQMHALSAMSNRLKQHDRNWDEEADALLEKLLKHSFDGKVFHVYQSGTHREFTGGDSLYPFIPLVLGRYLPYEIFHDLVSALKEPGRFLTSVGLASESLKSPYYEDDSYWRGPVWPCVMLLLILGIADGGETGFAKELAEGFCQTIMQSGFSENFQAKTGCGLRDPAHTWTAAAFLALAGRYL